MPVEVITYQNQFKDVFKKLNLHWIEKFFRIESKDLEQVNNPEACLAEGGEIFFVMDEGKAVGTCALYKVDHESYELAKMAVEPSSQGKGYGDLLMEKAEAWAKSKNAKKIIILSNTVLNPAITLYKKHGYEVIHLGPHPDYERCNIELRKFI